MRRSAPTLTALVLATTLAACGSDDVTRTYTDVRDEPCAALGTAQLVTQAYGTMTVDEPEERVEGGDVEKVGTCTVEAKAAGAPAGGTTGDLPAEVTVAVTVSVLEQGDPADDFSRLSDYATGLYDPAAVDDVKESTEDLDDGWWSRGTAWRTSWSEAGAAPAQLVETATVLRDNLQVSIVVVERDLDTGALTTAEERVRQLVVDQLGAAEDAVSSD
jgi:hypothetical protein